MIQRLGKVLGLGLRVYRVYWVAVREPKQVTTV